MFNTTFSSFTITGDLKSLFKINPCLVFILNFQLFIHSLHRFIQRHRTGCYPWYIQTPARLKE